MNCYYHHNVPAVGTCKNCHKGICPECLTDVENGIACTVSCVEEVKTLNSLIAKNKNLSQRASGAYNRTTFIYFSMGALFFYAAIVYPGLKLYMLPAGCLFVF